MLFKSNSDSGVCIVSWCSEVWNAKFSGAWCVVNAWNAVYILQTSAAASMTALFQSDGCWNWSQQFRINRLARLIKRTVRNTTEDNSWHVFWNKSQDVFSWSWLYSVIWLQKCHYLLTTSLWLQTTEQCTWRIRAKVWRRWPAFMTSAFWDLIGWLIHSTGPITSSTL